LEDDEHTGRPRTVKTELRCKMLQRWCVPTAPKQ
jgi:hypothetical protein